MPLVSITDLEREPPDRVAQYIRRAERLRPMYDQFIAEDEQATRFETGWAETGSRAPGLHASELSGCQRIPVYSLLGTRPRGIAPAFWKRKFRWGHVLHDTYRAEFAKMCAQSGGRLSFQSELRIAPELQPLAREWQIQSHCDGEFGFYDDPDAPVDLRVSVEIKGLSTDEFKRLKRPYEHHLDQATVYMACLDSPLMWLMYADKGSQDLAPSEAPFLVPFMRERWERILERSKARLEDARLQRLPEREEGFHCEFCAYSWSCDPEYLRTKAARAAARAERKRLSVERSGLRQIRSPEAPLVPLRNPRKRKELKSA